MGLCFMLILKLESFNSTVFWVLTFEEKKNCGGKVLKLNLIMEIKCRRL